MKFKFEPRLESMRGIAALIVAAHHGMIAFNGHSSVLEWFMWPTNPGSAVFFFFVLSGYVLGRALERDSRPFAYLVQRIFRIAPMLIASVLLAFSCLTLVKPDDQLSVAFRAFFVQPSMRDVADNILLQSYLVNGPSWSLYPEVIGSMLLAALVPLHCAIRPRCQWPTFVTVFIVLSTFNRLHLGLWFYAGFFLPHRIAPLLARHVMARWACFAVGFILLRYLGGGELYKFKIVAPSAIAGVMMIAPVIASETFLTSLNARPLRFLGLISYSFYLLHWPMFYLTATTASAFGAANTLGNIVVCMTSILATICAAAASYYIVEAPMMKIGRAIIGKASAGNGTGRL
ncbi:acyltransferase family protein [Bradyrhizobium symbiodeficiens]|uniref:acyltransferase family protein n=1 Tax=Bradyrhizobium symbiodeficiens TaxID=1404367 RepID=UPI00140F90EB|nr:acyltransferase [Bradyrhizobium symbiodeficiens]QIP01726.1 acyltransferase [Bradyrhizobium symbiodeficiens]